MNDHLWTSTNALASPGWSGHRSSCGWCSSKRMVGVRILVFTGLSDWLDGEPRGCSTRQARSAPFWTRRPTASTSSRPCWGSSCAASSAVARAWCFIGREVYMAVPSAPCAGTATGPPPVHFVGEAATLCLLYAFPLLFLGVHTGTWATVAKVIGWAFTIWGSRHAGGGCLLHPGLADRQVDDGSGALKEQKPDHDRTGRRRRSDPDEGRRDGGWEGTPAPDDRQPADRCSGS